MCKVNTVDNISAWTAQITESIQSYQRPFRYLGVFPFIESTGTTKVNRLALAWSYCIATIVLALSLQYLVISPTTFDLPKILVIISKILSITVATSQIVSVTFLVIYRHTLNSVFQILRQIDRKLTGLNPKFSFKYPISSITLLMITLVLLIICSPSIESRKEISVFWLTTFFIHIIAYLYTRTILLIKYCFNFINKSLKQEANNLAMLLDCYDLLLNCCDDFNKCIGPSLLTIMTSSFCILTFDFYLLFSTKYNDIYVNLRSIIGILFYINLVMHVIWTSHSTVKEVCYHNFCTHVIKYILYEKINNAIKRTFTGTLH